MRNAGLLSGAIVKLPRTVPTVGAAPTMKVKIKVHPRRSSKTRNIVKSSLAATTDMTLCILESAAPQEIAI